MAMGIYFIFLRPPLLPEDLKYMGSSIAEIQNNLPRLSGWLQKVFWVMGGYILTTGLLSVYVAQTTFRTRAQGSLVMVLISTVTSISLMAVVNFMIGSDFKWVLTAFVLPWIVALILYCFHK